MTDDDWHSLGLMSDDELEAAIRRLTRYPWIELVMTIGLSMCAGAYLAAVLAHIK